MNDNTQIEFRYLFPDDYRPAYCNGVHGGIMGNGDIVANFFFEKPPIPRAITNSVNEKGMIDGVIAVAPPDLNNVIIRHISSGIVMNEGSLRVIYEWMGRQIMELEERKKMGGVKDEQPLI